MLGNQYFMARNYSAAAVQLQGALERNPLNKAVRRRLIICLIQTGAILKAFEIFRELVREDADFIIDIDPIADDCPCPQLAEEGEQVFGRVEPSLDHLLKMGMIWLYCDLDRSIHYLRDAANQLSGNIGLLEVLQLLTKKQSERNDRRSILPGRTTS